MQNTECKSCFCLGPGPRKTAGLKFLTEVRREVPWCPYNLRLKMKLKAVTLTWQSPCQVVEVTAGNSWNEALNGINKTVGSY